MKKGADLKIDLNAKDSSGKTAFHFACFRGNSTTVEMIMKKAADLKIDLNAIDCTGKTAFHYSCMLGQTKIVETIIDNANHSKINLLATAVKPNSRPTFRRYVIQNQRTGFSYGNMAIKFLILRKMPSIAKLGHINVFSIQPL